MSDSTHGTGYAGGGSSTGMRVFRSESDRFSVDGGWKCSDRDQYHVSI